MIRLDGISKSFSVVGEVFYALDKIDLVLPETGLIFITGKSGSGKSTLLSILGGILSPSGGHYYYDDSDVSCFSKKEKEAFLREKVSFVFQDFNLIQDFSIRENLSIAGGVSKEDQEAILSEVSLLGKATTTVSCLSGGEKQRLAIARALAKKTETLLLDEPTGNLDKANSAMVFSLLRSIAKQRLVIVVSHDEDSIKKYGDAFFRLEDGEIVERGGSEPPEHVFVPFEDADSEFLSLLSDVDFSKCETITIREAGSSFSQTLPKKEKALFLAGQISSRAGQRFGITAERKLGEDYGEPPNISFASGVPSFGAKKRFAYAFALQKKRPGRVISTIFSLSLGIALLFAHSSLLFFSEEKALSSAFLSEGLTISPVLRNEINQNTGDKADYVTGERIRIGLEGLFDSVFPYFTASLVNAPSPTLVYVVGIDEEIVYRGVKVTKPELWSASVSSFLFDLNGKDDISLSFTKESWSAEADLKITSSLDFGYDSRELAHHISDQTYQYKKRDIFQTRCSLAFVSRETLEAIVSSSKLYTLHGGNFTLAEKTTKTYFDATLSYSSFSDEPLNEGSSPKGFGVVVSADWASANLLATGEVFSNLVGREYILKDLNASPNWVLYQSYPNLFSLTNRVTITGVTSSKRSDVYVSEEFLSAITNSLMDCSDGFEAYAETPDSLAHGFSSGPFCSSLNLVSPIYEIETAVRSVLFYVLLVAGLALLIISGLFMSLSCLSNVKEKTKEIAVLRSLGIPQKSVSSVFVIENCFLAIVSSLVGLFLGWLFIFGINQAFMDAEVFGISYSLLFSSPLAYFLGIQGALAIALSATIPPIKKANEIDIASTLRSL